MGKDLEKVLESADRWRHRVRERRPNNDVAVHPLPQPALVALHAVAPAADNAGSFIGARRRLISQRPLPLRDSGRFRLASVAELVDAAVSKTDAWQRAGSSPAGRIYLVARALAGAYSFRGRFQ